MQNYNVRMNRHHMENIPQFRMPSGFHIRNYRRDEGHIWTRIQRAAEPYMEIDDGLFEREFGSDLPAMEDRSFFLITDTGHEIGTITAWWQAAWGRIHWVAIHPDYQGRGLSKPMMAVAMARLQRSHDRCFLNTSTARLPAIKVYLDFGFTPDLSSAEDRVAWAAVADVLDHPLLKTDETSPL